MAALQQDRATDSAAGRLRWSGHLLGFALGGFFDGILLHQILQWHHLLSALEGDAFRDIRVQILADGLFHALMYLVGASGLWLLWRARPALAAPGAGSALLARLLIGFGAWHVVDALLSHWIVGIHRIRVDSPTPLVWDVAWLAAFGLVPLAIGIALRRGGGPGGAMRGHIAALLAAAAVASGGAAASLPPPGVPQVMVYFRPGVPPAQVFAAAAAVDARVAWSDRSGRLWVFDLADPSGASALYRHGALFVANGVLAAGCLSWSRAI